MMNAERGMLNLVAPAKTPQSQENTSSLISQADSVFSVVFSGCGSAEH